MTELAEAFRRIINVADPKANSPITENNRIIKILADWGRTACYEIDKLQAKVDKLENQAKMVTPEQNELRKLEDEIKFRKLSESKREKGLVLEITTLYGVSIVQNTA